MRILVDENIPRITVDRLRELGHDIKDIRGTADEGIADASLWAVAVRESRLLITTDKAFREADWPGLLAVVRDATVSTSRAGGAIEP